MIFCGVDSYFPLGKGALKLKKKLWSKRGGGLHVKIFCAENFLHQAPPPLQVSVNGPISTWVGVFSAVEGFPNGLSLDAMMMKLCS